MRAYTVCPGESEQGAHLSVSSGTPYTPMQRYVFDKLAKNTKELKTQFNNASMKDKRRLVDSLMPPTFSYNATMDASNIDVISRRILTDTNSPAQAAKKWQDTH